MKLILSAALVASAALLSGCLDNARSALYQYCDGADAVLNEYANWDDLVPATYRKGVAKTAYASNLLCSQKATVTPRQAYDIAADLYRSLEIARAHKAGGSAWQAQSVARFDSLMRRAREAGLK